MAPTFVYDRGIATIAWGAPENVDMRFDMIRTEHRDGGVSAELTVYHGLNGRRQLLRRTRLNLIAGRSRTEEANVLGRRAKDIDFHNLLEHASWLVVDAQRSGQPAILLRDAVEPPDSGVLLHPLLVRRDPVILFGDGGASKSFIGLAAALSVHTGLGLLGYRKPVTKLRCAYLDFEWNPWPHRRRMASLVGEELPDLVYVPCGGTALVHQVDRLRRIFHDHRIEYAVIDSVALACDGPPEDSETVRTFFQALSRLEVGSLLLAHVNRQGDQEKPFGSAFWHNSARMTWNVQKAEESQDELVVSLFNRKTNDGWLEKPFGLRFEFGERTLITSAEVSDDAVKRRSERGSSTRLHDRLAGFLVAAHGATYDEAARDLSADKDSLRRAVTRDKGQTFTTWKDPNDKRITRLGLKEKAE